MPIYVYGSMRVYINAYIHTSSCHGMNRNTTPVNKLSLRLHLQTAPTLF